ncbi:Glycosyl transferase family 2 [Halanaeroarchaeum sp. HSR-CO]|uniref:glycosyltransferase family 2 protein n=1 Tax=Halanaeroarchaeum sp. HSR-CO TaxID=2866382 RepID=UPI00217CC4B4|nr:glycosyltransferase family 2 protein [Halanaeroarchaeum sp. HSR-CO]UWG47985.1 Glycosyl transferase family 2 [Halanaeroarchaeum sp. HSR-CO]
MYRGLTVGIVVPAYNEAGYVGEVVEKIPSIVDRAYVIDDGSTDETWDEIERSATRRNSEHDGVFDSLVVPIRHDENRGVGAAIKTGYLRAREESIDVTAVFGGDDQMDPERLPTFIDPIADGVAEYTKGNRFSRSEDWSRMPTFRLVGNVTLSYLTKIASGYWESMDSQNGYTAISLSALEDTDVEAMYEYYGYCNDLLIRLNEGDVTIADVPQSAEYVYADDWKSHIDYTEYIPRVSIMLLSGFLRRLRRKYLLQSYEPIAPLYLLGGATTTGGLLGFMRSLVDRSREDTGSWFLGTVVGAIVFLWATVQDREKNRELQVEVDPESDDSPEENADGAAASRSEAVDEVDDRTGNGSQLKNTNRAS